MGVKRFTAEDWNKVTDAARRAEGFYPIKIGALECESAARDAALVETLRGMRPAIRVALEDCHGGPYGLLREIDALLEAQ